MLEPTVSVIVPTFERAAVLERTLRALCSLDYPHDLLEILVVDDGSTDSTSTIAARFRSIRYIRQSNLGVASARNHGARLVAGDILIFVDDDIVVGRDNVRRHLAAHELYPDCLVAGQSHFDPAVRDELVQSPFGRFRLWSEDLFRNEGSARSGNRGRVEVLTVDTQNMSLGRDLFWKIGGFDERFPVGAEDQDLCWRGHAAGAVILRDHDIRVVHNDQHRDLQALCHREERGAIGLVYLARKHPDFPTPASLNLNGPIVRTDSPRLVARKILRTALTRPGALAFAHWIVRLVEHMRPAGGWPLPYLYRAITGLYVFRGTRRGLQLTAGSTWEPGHPRRAPVANSLRRG